MRHKSTADLRWPGLWRSCVGAWNAGLGPTGTILRDQSTMRNSDATIFNGTWVASEGSYAVSLNGTSSYIDCGPVLSRIFGASYSGPFSLWISTRPAATGGYQSVVDAAGRECSIFLFGNYYGFGTHSAATTWNATAGEWQSFVMQRQLSGLTTGSTWRNNTNISSTDRNSTGFNASSLVIGKNTSAGGTWYGGLFREMRLYDRMITPNEIYSLNSRPNIAYETRRRRVYSGAAAAGGTAVPVFAHHYRTLARS